MMGECRDRSFQDLLHAFELGLLSDTDRKRVQEHLLECEYCFGRVSKLQETARLIRSDDDVKATVESIIREEAKAKLTWGQFLKRLWPETAPTRFLKPLAVAALLLILTYPVYRIAFDTGEKRGTQQIIKLYPGRAATRAPISLADGGQAVINFVFDGGQPGYSYQVRISSFKGKEIFTDEDYSGFNDSGLGSVTIPVERFSRGVYILTITNPRGIPPDNRQEYYFRVE